MKKSRAETPADGCARSAWEVTALRGAAFWSDFAHRSAVGKGAKGVSGWQVHAYCLMSNHFHLVVETPRANLVEGMKWLLGTYTMRFNRRHKLSGHLLPGVTSRSWSMEPRRAICAQCAITCI